MRGIIYCELHEYLEGRLGRAVWSRIREEAGAPERRYRVAESYPDEELVALVLATSSITGVSLAATLEDFGVHLAPVLANTYSTFIRPTWRTLDLLENTEEIIHKAVRVATPGADPPRLHCIRSGPGEVHITYTSERRMCALAKGLVRGVAGLYEETVAIDEHACMLDGDPSCELTVRLS